MIPEDANVGDIVSSLKSDAVFISPSISDIPTDDLHHRLTTSIADISQSEQKSAVGDLKIIATDQHLSPTQLRDLAQTVKDQTQANTVLAQSPTTTSTVADNISRFSIEKEQQHLGGYGNTEKTAEFLTAIAQPEDHSVVNASGLTALLLAVVGSAWAAKKFNPQS